MKHIISIGLLLALGCGSVDDQGIDPTDDDGELGDGSDLGMAEEAITIQFASSGAPTGRLMQGYRHDDTFAGACDTGTSCAPPKFVMYPQRTNNFTLTVCSDDAVLKSYLPTLVTASEAAVSGAALAYHVALANSGGGCSPATAGLKFVNATLSQQFGTNDVRSFTRFSCNGGTNDGTATAPAGSSSATYAFKSCGGGVATINVAGVQARGASASEDDALLKRMTRHRMATWLGAGGHSSAYNTAASAYNFAGAVGSTPAVLSSGESCRFKNYNSGGGAFLSSSAGCANN